MSSNQFLNSNEDKEEELSINSFDPFALKKGIAYFNSNTEKNNGKINEEFIDMFEEIDKNEKENDLLLDEENSILGPKKFGDNFSSENLFLNMKEFDDISNFNFQLITKKLNLDDSNNISTSKKNTPLNTKGIKRNLFETIYPNENDIIASTKTQINNDIISQKRPREKEVQKGTKLMDSYNIKEKIQTHFFNQNLFNKINNEIKKVNPKFFFEKFPHKFILSLIAKKQQEEGFKLTLEKIIEKSNHKPNLDILNQLRSDEYKNNMEKSDIEKILEMKISDLFKEYLNSDEFNKDIEKYKKTIGNEYSEKYLKIAKKL